VSGLRRNIELKARCVDLPVAAATVQQLGARRQGFLVQTDTYFHANNGRLKLREFADKTDAELIWYARADSTDFRGSDYYVVPIPRPADAKAALSAALGVRGVVRKRRELWLWGNVRIHLDDVEHLGTFVEFEAVISDPADEAPSHERLDTLARALHITDADRVSVSYSDLLGI